MSSLSRTMDPVLAIIAAVESSRVARTLLGIRRQRASNHIGILASRTTHAVLLVKNPTSYFSNCLRVCAECSLTVPKTYK